MSDQCDMDDAKEEKAYLRNGKTKKSLEQPSSTNVLRRMCRNTCKTEESMEYRRVSKVYDIESRRGTHGNRRGRGRWRRRVKERL